MEFLTERCLRRKIEPEKIAECFNAAFVVRSAPRRSELKGLTASALAAKFRDEFETVRCGVKGDGREIVVKVQVKIDIEPRTSHHVDENYDEERHPLNGNVEEVMAFWTHAYLGVRKYVCVRMQPKRTGPKAHL